MSWGKVFAIINSKTPNVLGMHFVGETLPLSCAPWLAKNDPFVAAAVGKLKSQISPIKKWSWRIPNLYFEGNGWKSPNYPIETGCSGFQGYIYIYVSGQMESYFTFTWIFLLDFRGFPNDFPYFSPPFGVFGRVFGRYNLTSLSPFV